MGVIKLVSLRVNYIAGRCCGACSRRLSRSHNLLFPHPNKSPFHERRDWARGWEDEAVERETFRVTRIMLSPTEHASVICHFKDA